MSSKNELYTRYYSALGYLADSMSMNNKEKKLLKERVHNLIKKKKNVLSITELSHEEMHNLVNEIYDFFPIDINELNNEQ